MEIIERKILTFNDVQCNLEESTMTVWDDETDYTLPAAGSPAIQVQVPWESDMTTMIMPDHIYELQADSAAGHYPPDHPSEWKDKGATNKYKMFDKFIMTPAVATGEETESPGQIVLEVKSGKSNSVHLFGLDATDLVSEVFDSADNLIDTQTFSLIDSSRIISWSTFFLEERPMLTELHFSIPIRPISKLRLTISDSRTDKFPGLGTFFHGLARDIGTTKYGIKSTPLDFSTIKRDPNTGEQYWERGDYAKFMTLDARVQPSLHDYLQNLLTRLRGQPVVVSGNNPGIQYSSFVVLGLLQEPELVLKSHNESIFNLKMEGFI